LDSVFYMKFLKKHDLTFNYAAIHCRIEFLQYKSATQERLIPAMRSSSSIEQYFNISLRKIMNPTIFNGKIILVFKLPDFFESVEECSNVHALHDLVFAKQLFYLADAEQIYFNFFIVIELLLRS
jgi:hypothetical protein